MNYRLKVFDYKAPFFYMVTIKKLKGARSFCAITRESEAALYARVVGAAEAGKSLGGAGDSKTQTDAGACAEGRVLFLSRYSAEARKPTNSELCARCQEMKEFCSRIEI